MYKITAMCFILHAVFGRLLQLFSTSSGKVVIQHLGWLSHWTMGWARHLDCASPATAVRGRAWHGLIVDRRDAKRPAAS